MYTAHALLWQCQWLQQLSVKRASRRARLCGSVRARVHGKQRPAARGAAAVQAFLLAYLGDRPSARLCSIPELPVDLPGWNPALFTPAIVFKQFCVAGHASVQGSNRHITERWSQVCCEDYQEG